MENVHKVAIVVVNAETQPDTKWDRHEGDAGIGCHDVCLLLDRIERYNEETIALIKESVKSWAAEIKAQRLQGGRCIHRTGFLRGYPILCG